MCAVSIFKNQRSFIGFLSHLRDIILYEWFSQKLAINLLFHNTTPQGDAFFPDSGSLPIQRISPFNDKWPRWEIQLEIQNLVKKTWPDVFGFIKSTRTFKTLWSSATLVFYERLHFDAFKRFLFPKNVHLKKSISYAVFENTTVQINSTFFYTIFAFLLKWKRLKIKW